MADFIDYVILIIFQAAMVVNGDPTRSAITACRRNNIYEYGGRSNFLIADSTRRFINSKYWPINYISNIELLMNEGYHRPVLCIPLEEGIDEVVKQLAYEGCNIRIISPKRITEYLEYTTDKPIVCTCSNEYLRYTPEDVAICTDVCNKLKADQSISHMSNVKFIEFDDLLGDFFDDLNLMKEHNHVYVTNNSKYADLMYNCYYPSSFFHYPLQHSYSRDGYKSIIKLIDEIMSGNNSIRPIVIYIEDKHEIYNVNEYYAGKLCKYDSIIPLFNIKYD